MKNFLYRTTSWFSHIRIPAVIVLLIIPQFCSVHSHLTSEPMPEEERLTLKDEAREMFYHAYNAYMANAYPADELMPLSCAGRYRDLYSSRGDIDDVLGNYSLTLVDTLDTLAVLGDIDEFEKAIKLVIRDVSFDTDVIVSVFETNIRMVGGLISGHILAEHLNQLYDVMSWYNGELLEMATDLATRLLPAFNTTTGVPYPRINLRHGIKSAQLQNSRDTCTSCAGTMILEFASLSRLTGDSIFEEKARHTMDYLWQQRHRGSDLVGTVLNIQTGDWIRRDSGVGAGIDSYYEYLLKAYVLLGDHDYLHRFNKHYAAVMKYVSQGPMLLDVHMHRPHTTTRNFMDALLAFWPGLQVLKGDIKPAIETHEMLYQVMQRHKLLPEAFTTDFQVHWGQHLLRPEFVESTYLLHEATEDPYYLRVGKEMLRTLQRNAWVPCGYAAVKDVRTGIHEDRMDSFVLSETFKYLYLLFSKANELPINLADFVFTTEAHLLPLSLARVSSRFNSSTRVPVLDSDEFRMEGSDAEFSRSCPNAHSLFPGKQQFAENIRKPLKNYVNSVCPNRHRSTIHRKLTAQDFQTSSTEHIQLLRDMGITMLGLADGRVQFLHTSASAKTPDDAEEGLLFMQEIMELSREQQDQPDNPPKAVIFAVEVRRTTDGSHSSECKNDVEAEENKETSNEKTTDCSEKESSENSILVKTLTAGPAQFGLQLKDGITVDGKLVVAAPYRACTELDNASHIKGNIVLMERGDCLFIDKARVIQKLGAIGGIVVDNSATPTGVETGDTPPLFAMSGDDSADDVTIPMVFLFKAPAKELIDAYEKAGEAGLDVLLSDLSKDKVAASSPSSVTSSLFNVESKGDSKGGPSLLHTIFASKDKARVKGESSCSDDLITLVNNDKASSPPPHPPVPEKGAFPAKSVEILLPEEKDVLAATSAEELLYAVERYIDGSLGALTTGYKDTDWLMQRVLYLLSRKGEQEPTLLKNLLANHVTSFVMAMEKARLTVSSVNSNSIDSIVNELVKVLLMSSVKTVEQQQQQNTGDSASTETYQENIDEIIVGERAPSLDDGGDEGGEEPSIKDEL